MIAVFASALVLGYLVDLQGFAFSFRARRNFESSPEKVFEATAKVADHPVAAAAPDDTEADPPIIANRVVPSLDTETHEKSSAANDEGILENETLVKQKKERKQKDNPPAVEANPEGAPNTHSENSAPRRGGGKHSSPVFKKVPMNRDMTELQVPGGMGTLSDEGVKGHYRKLAKAYLSSFTQGIYRHMFFDVLRRRTYSLTPPGANKGVQSIMFQIINRKVYMMDPYEVPKNSKPFYRTRINEIIWLLSKLAIEGRLKNTEFMVSIHDCVQTVNAPHMYRGATYQESIPSFNIVSCNFSDNIPFPMWEGDAQRGGGFQSWDKRMQEYATASQQAWSSKEEKAVFRGGNRPSMYFQNKSDANKNCDEVGRTRISFLASQHPNAIDASIGGSCGGVHRYLQRMDEVKQQKFKYVIYAEGNCFWADRLNKQVFGPSMILKQETPCGQFWEPLLKPMTHYVPADFFFNNLVDQVEWARENDDEAQKIVRNANEFANNFLTLNGIMNYVEVLMAEYTALLVEPDVKLEPGAIEVTNKLV